MGYDACIDKSLCSMIKAAEKAIVSADQGVKCRPIPVGMQSLLQNVIWRHAQHVHNAH